MTPDMTGGLGLLSAMITPAVLISACGTLILSTSMRLARVVDRVRRLSEQMEAMMAHPMDAAAEVRHQETYRQLETQAQRGRLIQRALNAFYVAVGIFVAATLSIAMVAWMPHLSFVPSALGMIGTLSLFYGCVLLIGETRLAIVAVDLEMEHVLRLQNAAREHARK